MNSRFGSIAGDPRAVASSSCGLCSKRSVRLPLPTKPWSNRQSQPSTYWGKLSQGDTHLLVIALLIVIPLAYTDHLPDFHWKNVIVGPPIRPINIQHVRAQTAIISLRPVFNGPTRIFNPISLPKGAQPSTEAVLQPDLAALTSVDT